MKTFGMASIASAGLLGSVAWGAPVVFEINTEFSGATAPDGPAPWLYATFSQTAQQALSNAERTDAGRYAAGELGEARAKLASANAAVLEERMVAAARLADQSRVEAELALARTAAAKAAAVNEETKRSTKTLIDEMQRNTGDQS